MTRLLLLSVLTFALTGCGTTANLAMPEHFLAGGPPKRAIYGGVTNDVEGLKTAAVSGNIASMLIAAGCVVDIPLSAVADTLTLPLTVPTSVHRSFSDYYFPKDPKPEQLPNWLQDSQPSHLGMTNDPPMTHQ